MVCKNNLWIATETNSSLTSDLVSAVPRAQTIYSSQYTFYSMISRTRKLEISYFDICQIIFR